MDSTLAVQQFIQQTIRRDPSNLEAILKMPEAQDEGVWKYEHLRLVHLSLFYLVLDWISGWYWPCINNNLRALTPSVLLGILLQVQHQFTL